MTDHISVTVKCEDCAFVCTITGSLEAASCVAAMQSKIEDFLVEHHYKHHREDDR